MKDIKKEAPEVPAQEQQEYTAKDLTNLAAKIIIMLYENHLSTIAAKKVLEECNKLIELNSQLVMTDNKIRIR